MLLHNADPTMINIRNETARDLADVSGRKIISMAITEATGVSSHDSYCCYYYHYYCYHHCFCYCHLLILASVTVVDMLRYFPYLITITITLISKMAIFFIHTIYLACISCYFSYIKRI